MDLIDTFKNDPTIKQESEEMDITPTYSTNVKQELDHEEDGKSESLHVSGIKTENVDIKTESQGDIFLCRACEDTFETEEQLTDHKSKSTECQDEDDQDEFQDEMENIYVCSLCNQIFETKDEVIGHKKANVECHEHKKCSKCEVKSEEDYSCIWELKDHLKVAHGVKDQEIMEEEAGSLKCCSKKHKQKLDRTELLALSKESDDEVDPLKNSSDGYPNYSVESVHSDSRILVPTSNEFEGQLQNPDGKNVRFSCKLCGKSYSQKKTLIIHNRIHTGERPFACKKCDKAFPSSSQLKQHEITHMIQKPHQCRFCPKSYLKKYILIKHEKIHLDDMPKCKTCGQVYANRSELEKHELTHLLKKPYQCKLCSNSYTAKFYLAIHQRTHTGEKPYQCNFCTRTFYRYSNMKQHQNIKHMEEKPYECSFCPKSFSKKFLQQKHERIHTGRTPFRCKSCNKLSSYNQLLQEETSQFVAKHTLCNYCIENPFNCRFCVKSFTTKAIYEKHMSTHSAEKPFLCSLCPKTFGTNSNRKRHMLTHTENQFHCKFCEMSFLADADYQEHLATHSDKQSFTCEVCSASFSKRSNRDRHIVLKHKSNGTENAICCKLCDSSFSTKTEYQEHLATHASDNPFTKKSNRGRRMLTQKSELLSH